MSFLKAAYIALSHICSRIAYCTFPHMWHPCWISPLPLHHKKSWELWNTGSYALNWKCTWKSHPSAQIIFTTAKQVKRQEKVSLPCHTFHKMTAASVLIFCQEVLLLMLFLLWSQLGVSGPASFWQDTRAGSTCFLSSDPCIASGRPHSIVSFSSLPWPNTVTGQRLIPMQHANRSLSSEQSSPRRGALSVGQMGTSVAILGQDHLLSAKMPHPMRFSLQWVLQLTLQWSLKIRLFLHS